MKRKFLIYVSVLFVVLVTGCASTKASYGVSATVMAKELGAPAWYFKGNMIDSEGIYAVGRADFADDIISEKAARIDGRANLAQMLEAAVTYIGNTSITADTEVKRVFQENSQVIAKQVLVGSVQVDRFDIDGKVSVLMFQPYKSIMRKLKLEAKKQSNADVKSFMENLTLEELVEAIENNSME